VPPITKSGGRVCAALAATLFVVLAFAPPVSAAPASTLVSVASAGGSGNGDSTAPATSADGHVVAFTSAASDLVAGDTNGAEDVFVRDTTTGQTERISVATDGSQSNGVSLQPAISADGRFVAFTSFAFNLVPGDTNLRSDVFVHDRQTGGTERVNVSSSGAQATNASSQPSISADGALVAFTSSAPNLVTGDTNVRDDVFFHNRAAGSTTRVSVGTGGGQANGFSSDSSISRDGGVVAFASTANNLVTGDTNSSYDIFVRVLATGTTTRASVASDGTQSDSASRVPSLSADGRLVAFESLGSTLVAGDGNMASDIFLHDTAAGTTAALSVATDGSLGDAASHGVSLSGAGVVVVFSSSATNLVPSDTNAAEDVFARDRELGETAVVSLAPGGTPASGQSTAGRVSEDGRVAAYSSKATNLSSGDSNGAFDVFKVSVVRDADGDGVLDPVDNCPDDPNPGQLDTDGDGAGDACDADDDGDGAPDGPDNCALTPNADQLDTDGDGAGNACDGDDDDDSVPDAADNCALTPNVDQLDSDGDGGGDACDGDDDGDAVPDSTDNCALTPNADQLDTDGDGAGNACEDDDDADGVADATDNCALSPNADQVDTDGDGAGNACEDDDDADGVADGTDNCALTPNSDQADADGDGRGNACDDDGGADVDADDDSVRDEDDVCPLLPGLEARQGCPVGVNVHLIVYVGDHPKRGECPRKVKCQDRPEGALVRVFDQDDPAFRAAYGDQPSKDALDAIFSGIAGRLGDCVTGTSGGCTVGTDRVRNVFVVARFTDASVWVFVAGGRSIDRFVDTDGDGRSDLAWRDLRVRKRIDKDGSVRWSGHRVQTVASS
jgi:Tol biopolymer transport system component